MKLPIILKSSSAAILMLIAVTACDSSKKQEDSTDMAKEQNEAVLDDRDEEKDADFVVNAVAANYAEIKMAQLAQTKSSDPGIKEMAALLEKDHTELVNQFTGYAAQKGLSVPMQEASEDQKDINKLAEEPAADFDKKWCDMLEDRHQKSINKFEKRLDKTDDTELKNLLTNALPALRVHHNMLKEQEDKMK